MSRLYQFDIMSPIMEVVMSLLRPLDPSFPIERQIAIDASPVVLVNLFTLDKADEETFLNHLLVFDRPPARYAGVAQSCPRPVRGA